MAFFTGIFTIRESVEIIQVDAGNQRAALLEMIGRLPHDDAFDFPEADYTVLSDIMSCRAEPTLAQVTGSRNIWYWLDGSRLEDRIDAYVIKTDKG